STEGGSRCFSSRATNTANTTPNRAIVKRAQRCQRFMRRQILGYSNPQILKFSNLLLLRPLEVGQGELNIRLAIVIVLFEGEGDIERRLVFREEVVTLGGAPGDGAEDSALLFQRHLQVPFFQLARAVDDFDAAGGEDRAGIAGAERRQRKDAGC